MPQTIPKQYTQTVKSKQTYQNKTHWMQKKQSSKLEIIYTLDKYKFPQKAELLLMLSNIMGFIAWSVTRQDVLATGQ